MIIVSYFAINDIPKGEVEKTKKINGEKEKEDGNMKKMMMVMAIIAVYRFLLH